MISEEAYHRLVREFQDAGVTLVAVSKTRPVEDILSLYKMGQRDFGENYVQEMVAKQLELPSDIQWHFIGHLQRNKVKQVISFVHLIHGIDSLRLLETVSQQSARVNRRTDCLLQVHIASEETKFGFSPEELAGVMPSLSSEIFSHVRVRGLMGMASFTSNQETIRQEFRLLKNLFDECRLSANPFTFDTLSMGMSADYTTAIREGSTMVRIGSMLFGARV